MTTTEINTEIKKTKEMMDLLFACVNDKALPIADRQEYYNDYQSLSVYYLKLNAEKPSHELSIA